FKFTCGTNASSKFTALTTLEIDWSNSSWASTSVPQLSLSAALDATELNRIMNALPTVSGKTMDIGWCDGYFTCDRSIAQAKGWTVRGLAFVTTADATTINPTNAILGGEVVEDGGVSITSRGVCY